jgi:AcrR family transcriptional regulator
MPPPTRTPPSKWIEQGLRALAAGGPDAVRIEALARALGVTKGGFYSHFEDRPALLGEMLDTWEGLVIDQVIAQVEGAGGDARNKLRTLLGLGSSAASELMAIELAIREWARRDTSVSKHLRRIDSRRMAYLRSLFAEICDDEEEAEMRSFVTLCIFAGGPTLATDHAPAQQGELLGRAHEWLLES